MQRYRHWSPVLNMLRHGSSVVVILRSLLRASCVVASRVPDVWGDVIPACRVRHKDSEILRVPSVHYGRLLTYVQVGELVVP